MKSEKFVSISIILSILPAIYFAFFPGKIVLVTIICSYPLILIGLSKWKSIFALPSELYINLFFCYSLIILFRGFIDVKTHQDWSNLISSGVSVFLFLPLAIFFGRSISLTMTAIKTYVIIGIPLVFILFFIPNDSGPFGFSHMISPIYLLILLIPFIKLEFVIYIIIVSVISFFSDILSRSNLINIIVAFLICFTYIFKNSNSMFGYLKIFRAFLLYSPFIFILLGAIGVFNVFKIGDNFKDILLEDGSGNSQPAFIDSRTGIYKDVFTQLSKDKAFFFGLGASGKTKTYLTDVNYGNFDKVYSEGRRGTESGMLNYIQYGGILGGFIYFMLFFRASYLAVYKSNNWLMVMIGIWVSFKGFYSFIEDTTVFSVSIIFIFIPIGMCFNKDLRSMNEDEIKSLLRKTLYLRGHSPHLL